MTWSDASTVKLGHIWIYTNPVEGEYFKLKHSILLEDTPYLLAQCQFNPDGSIEFYDIQQRFVRQKLEVIRLTKPPIFGQRRLAFKRLTKGESMEEQIRRIVSTTFLQPRASQFPPQRSDWTIDLDVSDYVQASTIDGGTY